MGPRSPKGASWMGTRRQRIFIGMIALGLACFFLRSRSTTSQWDDKPGKGVNDPYGGTLRVLLVDESEKEAMKKEAVDLPSYQLNDRQLCDIELLLNGAFSPLRGFMNRESYGSVVTTMKLPSGLIWPMPITLDVDYANHNETFVPSRKVALRDSYFNLIAIMEVEDVYKPDKTKECSLVFGTTNTAHPGCSYVRKSGTHYVGGELRGFQLPMHYDFKDLRLTPTQLREKMARKKWGNIVAFQTRNPMHKAHIELTRRAAARVGGHVLLHPVADAAQAGDIDYITRVKCYQAILASDKAYYPPDRVLLSLLPLAMRRAGPREALWHAIVRKNYGATHFIVGVDHAGASDADGKPFYKPYEAQELALKHAKEIGIEVQAFSMMQLSPSHNAYVPQEELSSKSSGKDISGKEFRALLSSGVDVPEWFSDPDVVSILHTEYPPNIKRGFTLFYTGLSGSGKTTVAHALIPILRQHAGRKISLLDGDRMRFILTRKANFTKEDRDDNVKRLGYIASEISKFGGIAVVSAIAPYREARQIAREMVEAEGGAFFEVWQSTPLAECIKRDPKGLYEKALSGMLPSFTGISDPYEEPLNPDIETDGSKLTVNESVETILKFLRERAFLPPTARL